MKSNIEREKSLIAQPTKIQIVVEKVRMKLQVSVEGIEVHVEQSDLKIGKIDLSLVKEIEYTELKSENQKEI